MGVATNVLEAFLDEMAESFGDKYPGRASDVWCRNSFLASDTFEVPTYPESHNITTDRPPHDPWASEHIIYGYGFYEGMGDDEYPLSKFAFRIVVTPKGSMPYTSVRDEGLARKWVEQEKT